MRARSSWQSPGVGKLNTKTTGQTKGPEVRRARPPEAVRPGGGRAGGALARLVCPVVLVFNFPTPGLCHEDLARIFVLKALWNGAYEAIFRNPHKYGRFSVSESATKFGIRAKHSVCTPHAKFGILCVPPAPWCHVVPPEYPILLNLLLKYYIQNC